MPRAAALTLTLAAALAAPCAARAGPTASAELRDAKGERVGTGRLAEARDGVAVTLEVHGLSPGTHAFHVHAAGKCDPPDFTSAGPHFNPTGKKHGAKNPEGHHLGDLPNLVVGADGKGAAKATVHGGTLAAGPNWLLGTAGTALVVHEKPDDELTDPAGNAGPRIACGVVRAD
jgi:Cu-Zn family superoxide dismutase